MLDLHKHLAAARIAQDKTTTQRQIDATNQVEAIAVEENGWFVLTLMVKFF